MTIVYLTDNGEYQ